MKRFLIDTYRIFLLQTSKVIWDIIGFIIFIGFNFYNENNIWAVSILGPIAGIWLAIRLYWPNGRNKIEESESLRPISPYSKEFRNVFVLFIFFIIIYGITGYLYYNFRLARGILWVNEHYNLGLDLSQLPYRTYVRRLKLINPAYLEDQKENIIIAAHLFWYYTIPVAVLMRLKKLISRIIFIVIAISAFFVIVNLRLLSIDYYQFEQHFIFYIVYLIMLIYLIIPKRINFK